MIPILLSTACYHNKYESVIDAAIRAVKPNHEIDGIEVSFLKTSECFDFKANDELINYSKNNQIFLHACTKNIVYSDNFESNKVLNKLKNIYDLLNAKQITFHTENIGSIDYLIKQMKVCNLNIETPDVMHTEGNYFESIEALLAYPELSLTLDIEHSRNHLNKFMNYGIIERISEIHYSNYNPNINHDCYSTVFERFNKIIELIKLIRKPVVIEIDLRNYSQLNDEFIDESRFIILNEIKLLRDSLTSF
ncbi:MAG: hypothetical protein WC393_01870 [Candidatus Nanoarchaeia archaeon]|jgi:hypothetical protein